LNTPGHPRGRGDEWLYTANNTQEIGLSPRARGRPARRLRGLPGGRTTPAWAGMTPARRRSPCRTLDHPRLRGDDDGQPHNMITFWGPAPRARGRRLPLPVLRMANGPPPACGGTTWPECPPCRWSPDHPPRARGRHRGRARHVFQLWTTPTVWGRQLHRQGRVVDPRTTLACAGTTAVAMVITGGKLGPPPPAQGRLPLGPGAAAGGRTTPACAGTTAVAMVITGGKLGPPPPAQGRLPLGPGAAAGGRTTPACAGTTAVRVCGWRARPDYPRECGDDVKLRPAYRRCSNHPRVQGRPYTAVDDRPLQRTTPAWAGTTGSSSPRTSRSRDHPRVRGDDVWIDLQVALHVGLLPRARGRRDQARRAAHDPRSTPGVRGDGAAIEVYGLAP